MMKAPKLRRLAAMLLAAFAVLSISTNVFAVSADKAEKDELSAEDIRSLNEYYDIEPVDRAPQKGYMTSFEAAEDGRIAVSYDEHVLFPPAADTKKAICVFDEQGEFLYGYSFYCSGDAYAGWINANASILNVRASCIIEVSPECDIVGRYEYPVGEANASQQTDGKTYTAKTITDSRQLDYGEIIVTEKDGTEKTLISIGEESVRHNMIFYSVSGFLNILILFIIPAAVIVAVIIWSGKRRAFFAEKREEGLSEGEIRKLYYEKTTEKNRVFWRRL